MSMKMVVEVLVVIAVDRLPVIIAVLALPHPGRHPPVIVVVSKMGTMLVKAIGRTVS